MTTLPQPSAVGDFADDPRRPVEIVNALGHCVGVAPYDCALALIKASPEPLRAREITPERHNTGDTSEPLAIDVVPAAQTAQAQNEQPKVYVYKLNDAGQWVPDHRATLREALNLTFESRGYRFAGSPVTEVQTCP